MTARRTIDDALLNWPLFDERWYLARYPEVRAAGLDAREHYLALGEGRGYRPNPLFHTDWVRAHLPVDSAEPSSPLAAFVASGGQLQPNPLFDPAWYRDAHGERMGSETCSLTHYLAEGAAIDLAPHPLFDAVWYREEQPNCDVGREFAHYLDVGEAAGYWPNPLFDPRWFRERNAPFDPHCARCHQPLGALAHYFEIGSARGARPHPFFDPTFVRSCHPVIDRLGVEPLSHFLAHAQPASLQINAWVDTEHVAAQTAALPNPCFASYRVHLDAARAIVGTPSNHQDPLFDYLDRAPRGQAASPAELFPHHESVVASIIIPTFDHWFYTFACLHALASVRTELPFEVIVADDGSQQPPPEHPLLGSPGLQLLRSERNRGFIHACNAGARAARGEFLVFLNNDTLICEGWLDQLISTFGRFEAVGIVGSKLLLPNGRVGEAGGLVWGDASAWNFGRHRRADDPEVSYARDCDYVSGASLAIPRALFETHGGFDAAYAPAYFEDTDLAFRVRSAGKRVLYQPLSQLFHFEGVTAGSDLTRGVKRHQVINQETFAARWRDEVTQHGERGEAPDQEKDRHHSGHALVLDVCLPTPARDARSHAMVDAMKRLRDAGFKLTFVPENLDAPASLADPLRANGIQVLGGRTIASVEDYLRREGARFDLCWTGREAVHRRWRASLEQLCPKARTQPLELEFEHSVPLEPRTRRVEEDVFPGERSRRDVWVLTGTQEDAAADALLWLRDEIAPALQRAGGTRATPATLNVREHDWLDAIAHDVDRLRPIDEGRLMESSALDRWRVAVAPTRFGADLAGPIGVALARGLPCVATSHAAARLRDLDSSAIVVADDAKAFARAIVTLLNDDAAWRDASQAAYAHPAAQGVVAAGRRNLTALAR